MSFGNFCERIKKKSELTQYHIIKALYDTNVYLAVISKVV